ncbi:MAG TPA: hypothetical protein VFP91_12735 [Vicinamibacterales bacterium]|nr:hypothetical protein [Vicinamibacterales bacterium]
MTGRTIRRYQMLVRVSTFGAEHGAAFPIDTLAARTFVEVQETTSQLAQHAVAQASARSRDRVHVKAAARKRLRESLRVISRTARALAIDSPCIRHMFRLPRTNGDHALLTAARVMARDATGIEADFIEHGLPTTFVTEVYAAVAALEHATSEYESTKQAGAAARAGVDVVLARGRASVVRLDAIVANVCRNNPPMMAAWRQARRVERSSRTTAMERQPASAPIRLVTNVA